MKLARLTIRELEALPRAPPDQPSPASLNRITPDPKSYPGQLHDLSLECSRDNEDIPDLELLLAVLGRPYFCHLDHLVIYKHQCYPGELGSPDLDMDL